MRSTISDDRVQTLLFISSDESFFLAEGARPSFVLLNNLVAPPLWLRLDGLSDIRADSVACPKMLAPRARFESEVGRFRCLLLNVVTDVSDNSSFGNVRCQISDVLSRTGERLWQLSLPNLCIPALQER